MSVVAYDPAVTAELAEQRGVELVELDELMRRSDFVTIHAPLVEGTRNLIDGRVLRLARPGARLVNAARGGIVDETALFEALSEGRLAAAAMDLFLTEPLGGTRCLRCPTSSRRPTSRPRPWRRSSRSRSRWRNRCRRCWAAARPGTP